MEDVVVAVISKLAEFLVAPLVRQGQCMFCASNIVKTLEAEKQKLVSTQDGVQARVQEALNRTEKIVDAVEKWLAEVQSHMDDVQKLEQQMKDSISCFRGRCPTWRRYCLCRQLMKMIEATKNLNQRSEFNLISITAPLPDIEYFSSENFLYFQSTKMASDQLLAALQDDGIHMIGLYGMGGSGKTTLVKEIGKKAKELKLFDRVIFVTVSQNPDISKIQNEIADLLGLRFEEQSEAGRVRRLFMRLSSGERILMILDDVWNMINFQDVGIPFSDYSGCKILLTTRRQQVCNLLDCERKIPLHLLSEEESQTLFKKHARIQDTSLANVGQEIVRECKGLPIAIQAVGASLKGKSIEEWKEALRRLKDSKPINVEQGIRDAFSCLRLSYDYLNSNESKSLFLKCCMYPEDTDISAENLFRIAIGLGMCEELDSLEDARNQVNACINHLVESCLIMRSEEKKDCLRMHDTIRDVALWISSQENRTIVVNHDKDMKVATNCSIKDCYALTSWCRQRSQFPQRFDAPKLEILLLKNVGPCELSEANFGGTGTLKVMQIDSTGAPYHEANVHLSFLPHSLNFLANLQTLRLHGWKLGDDLSWLLGLKILEVLDLKYSLFEDLPEGLEQLSKLKLLDVTLIKERSLKIIERCTQLQEVYASEIELSGPTLKFGKCFSDNVTFPRLKRYQIEIGKVGFSFSKYGEDFLGSYSKYLSLEELKISALSPFIKDLVQRANTLFLARFNRGCKNIIPDILQVVGGMNDLTRLYLEYCSELECLADATSKHIDLLPVEALFPKLIKLQLHHLANLKEIWRGPPLLSLFEKLQTLVIYHCPMLTSLFPKCVARTILLLQKLTVQCCGKLETIIEEDGADEDNEIISDSNKGHLTFSKLKSLMIFDCDKLQYVFSNSCVHGLEQLEEICIEKAPRLKYAFGQYEDEHQEVKIKLNLLKSLVLKRLKNLLCIFPRNFYPSFPCLKEFQWVKCPKFNASCVNIMAGSNTITDKQLYSKASNPLSFLSLEKLRIQDCSVEDILFALEIEVFTERNSRNKLISALNSLKLNNLPELKFVWSGPKGTLSLQNLREFKVSGCNNLRNIFSHIILKCLPLLEHLDISNCNELEEIISGTEAGEQHTGPLNVQSAQICFPNLQILEVRRCNKLKCLFSAAIEWNDLSENILPNLRKLCLEEVPRLKDFCPGLSLSNDCLPQLLGSKMKTLSLGSLSEVWLIWRAPSNILNLVHLQGLTLRGCNDLKYIFGDNFHGSTLPKLSYLTVEQCNKLKSIFSISPVTVTLLLPCVYRIYISECEELERLFGHGGGEASSSDNVNEIVLPELYHVRLTKLPRLVDICNGFKLSALHLDSMYVENRPKFSSTGAIEVNLKREEAEIHANGNGDQIPYFYPNELSLMDLEWQELSELSFGCRPFTSPQNLSFKYLQSLTVERCGKLKCILSMSIWGSLPQLTRLNITECEQVEAIIQDLEEAHQNVSNYSNNMPFPELRVIEVRGCHKLKCLCRMARVEMLFPKLDRIEVSEAAQMEEIFSHTSDGVTTSMQEIELPNLYMLMLKQLPALTHFFKGFKLNAPYLLDVQIEECPNFDFSLVESTTSTGNTDEG